MNSATTRFVYIPIWTIKDAGGDAHERVYDRVYIPIWTIKDHMGVSNAAFQAFVYIPIWTIKDLQKVV